MFKPSIWRLNPLSFTSLIPKRNKKIDDSNTNRVKNISEYKANSIADSLHPHFLLLTVSEIRIENKDCKTFVLRKADGSLPAYFNAGSYLSIVVEINGVRYCRPYSLSSSPKQALEGFYTITVKRTDGGLVSNYLLDNVDVGYTTITSAPLGQFNYEPLRDSKHIIGIAGGSGITPFHSLAMAIKDGDEDCSLTLLYGSRTIEDALFLEDFKQIEKECPKFKLINVLSEELNDSYEHGFINAELIKKYVPKDEEYSVFVCGPKELYDFLSEELNKLDIRRKFIRYELFGETKSPAGLVDYVKPEKEEYDLTVRAGNKEYHVKASVNETLLNTMEKNNIHAQSDCRSGVCGWCHSQLISGDVYIVKDARRMADKKYGYIHPCVCFPLSDIVMEIPVEL